jgi:hypothetical protein
VTRVRAAVLGAVLWCVVVVAVSSLVWVVISRAGAGVVPVSQPQADVTGSLPVPGGGHPTGRPGGHLSPGVTLSPRPSHSGPSGVPSSGTTTTPVVPPPPASSSTTLPAPVAQRRSWSGPAGHVVAECRGAAGRLVAAYPNAGWRYLIGARGPGLVRVRFVRVGEDGRSVTVDARCVAGVPHFTLPARGSGDE